MTYTKTSPRQLCGVLGMVILTSASAQIAPEHAQNLTVYHLNPASAGALPVNMDTGDARGDLYFYLGEFLLPLECKGTSPGFRAHFDCDNPERVDPNLVVTKVSLEVDARTTKYSACNLCNGTDPFTKKPCQVGSYVCDCDSEKKGGCDSTKLGVSNITENFSPHVPTKTCENSLKRTCGSVKTDEHACWACLEIHKKQLKQTCHDEDDLWSFCPNPWENCNATSPEWNCWEQNIPRKTAGMWYSTLKDGQCTDHSAPGSCSWKVQGLKTVKEQCLKGLLMSRVESYGKTCFQGCGPRNATNPCWISCFFDTVLGVDARHSTSKPLSGMPMAEIEKSWDDAFLPREQGGCDEVVMPVWPEFVV